MLLQLALPDVYQPACQIPPLGLLHVFHTKAGQGARPLPEEAEQVYPEVAIKSMDILPDRGPLG